MIHSIPETVGFSLPMRQFGKSAYSSKSPIGDQVRKSIAKQRTQKPEPDQPTHQKVALGETIPVRPSQELPAARGRSASGQFAANPAYHEEIRRRQVWNAGMSQQHILQGSQFKEQVPLPKGQRQMAEYRTPKRGWTPTTLGKVQAEAKRVNKVRTKNLSGSAATLNGTR